MVRSLFPCLDAVTAATIALRELLPKLTELFDELLNIYSWLQYKLTNKVEVAQGNLASSGYFSSLPKGLFHLSRILVLRNRSCEPGTNSSNCAVRLSTSKSLVRFI